MNQLMAGIGLLRVLCNTGKGRRGFITYFSGEEEEEIEVIISWRRPQYRIS